MVGTRHMAWKGSIVEEVFELYLNETRIFVMGATRERLQGRNVPVRFSSFNKGMK